MPGTVEDRRAGERSLDRKNLSIALVGDDGVRFVVILTSGSGLASRSRASRGREHLLHLLTKSSKPGGENTGVGTSCKQKGNRNTESMVLVLEDKCK